MGWPSASRAGEADVSKVLAHRGVTYEAPDNSADAFAAAVGLGIHGVELDVRATADGALICHHDAVVEGIGTFCELELAALPASVCSFAEAMAILDGLYVNVEVKNDPREPGYDPSGKLTASVVAAICEGGWADSVVLSSFNPEVLEQVRSLGAKVPTGLLWDWGADVSAGISAACELGASAIHPWVLDLSRAQVAEAHAAGLAVNAWTVNGPLDIEHMGAWGVDGVITDTPAEALEILAKVPPEVPGS